MDGDDDEEICSPCVPICRSYSIIPRLILMLMKLMTLLLTFAYGSVQQPLL